MPLPLIRLFSVDFFQNFLILWIVDRKAVRRMQAAVVVVFGLPVHYFIDLRCCVGTDDKLRCYCLMLFLLLTSMAKYDEMPFHVDFDLLQLESLIL